MRRATGAAASTQDRIDYGGNGSDLIEVGGFQLPAALRAVADRLEQSRSILALGDDWDGEGSPGYREQTWRRAARVVVASTLAFHEMGAGFVPLPIISKGDDGSIDLQWRTPTRNVLINVPADAGSEVAFYAHDQEQPSRDVGGRLDSLASNERLLVWLTT